MEKVKVKIITPFFAEQTKTHYLINAEVSIPKDLAERHGAEGTGFIKVIPDKEAKSEPIAPKPPKEAKGK